jgi:hypothetical protein
MTKFVITYSVPSLGFGLDIRWIVVWFSVGSTVVSFVQVSRPALGPSQHYILWVKGFFLPGGKTAGGVNVKIHFHPVLRWRMIGSIHLRPPFAFMMCTGTTFHFSYVSIINDSEIGLLPILSLRYTLLPQNPCRKLNIWCRNEVNRAVGNVAICVVKIFNSDCLLGGHCFSYIHISL